MKTLAKLFAFGALMTVALLPVTTQAVSYYNSTPDYTCYYRDTTGRCLSYQMSTPYFPGSYGSQYTYPFNSLYNAYSVTPSPWDNRYANRYNPTPWSRYEEDDDDNDYLDDDDDYFKYYYDDDDDTYRRYRVQHGDYDDYDYDYGYPRGRGGNDYFEYEHTRVIQY